MYRIRIHGRGGQGIKMASRVLGTALFRAGFTVQDAPKYGAERRGAPIFSNVRADHGPINERGVISQPDLVVVADDTLLAVPAAGTLQGLGNLCSRLIPVLRLLGHHLRTDIRQSAGHAGSSLRDGTRILGLVLHDPLRQRPFPKGRSTR